jgi:hypothetical protein
MSETSVSNYQTTRCLYPGHFTVLLEGQVCYKHVMCPGDVDIRLLRNVGISVPGCTPSRMYKRAFLKIRVLWYVTLFQLQAQRTAKDLKTEEARSGETSVTVPTSRHGWEDWNSHEHPCETTLMLPCIVRFLLTNQPETLIIQIYSVIKLYIIINLHETYQCRMYNRKLLMMGREEARNM